MLCAVLYTAGASERREWQAQLQVVLDSKCVGMLQLETSALKASHTNTLKSAQATIAMLMVVAARRAAEAAIDKLQEVTRYASGYLIPLKGTTQAVDARRVLRVP